MSSHLKAELAATCSTLGRLHKGEYLIEPECIESVKDLIRYLKRDDEFHEIRRYLGESKVLQNDLIHIIKSCPADMPELFDVTLRLLINLTTPTMLFYGEEIPAEKIGRNIYISLIGYGQDYKVAFCDVDFWNQICGKLTNLFETEWAERSADDGIQIERILMLLRNVLQIPADVETENRPDNDITIHDKVLWALRQSQILELLLFVSSNSNEDQYYLNLLEIFSLLLREQNPKLLAQCDISRSAAEKIKDTDELVRAREMEKKNQSKYLNARSFNATFVMKGVKSLSNNDVVCHKPLDKVNSLSVNQNKKQVKVRRNRIPVESQRVERRSAFSIRLFLKEFCLEFITSGFNDFMSVVKSRLDSGKTLAHDQTYYFWALNFFLDFATAANMEVDLIKEFLSVESFHYVQTSIDNAFEHLLAEKKKTVDWVKRIHMILKAYHSLLQTLFWMDCSKNPLTRSISRQIKSDIFYVVEYREMTLHILLKYDSTKFSVSYLKDLIETTHLFIKLLEEYAKQTKLVVQKVMRKKSRKKAKKDQIEVPTETKEESWERIKDDVYDILSSENLFPEIPPFDAALDIPIDDQKGKAMKKIQKMLIEGNIKDGIGLLRSSRQVWPENDYFGFEGMSVEDETMALQEICLSDLDHVEIEENKVAEENKMEEEDEEVAEDEDEIQVVEHDFDIMDYKKRLVNKKVVEGCGILLKNYKQNSDHTNHCVIKLLHRIGWECCMPAMLYQASLFWTLLKIMKDKTKNYNEINTFCLNLLRRFRKHASINPVVFVELLFWKENNVALEIQHGYQPYECNEKPKKRSKKSKSKNEEEEVMEGEEHSEVVKVKKTRTKKKKSNVVEEADGIEYIDTNVKKRRKKNKNREAENNEVSEGRKKKTKKGLTKSNMLLDESDGEGFQEGSTNRTEVGLEKSDDKRKTRSEGNESVLRSVLDSEDENVESDRSEVDRSKMSLQSIGTNDVDEEVRTTVIGPVRRNTKSSVVLDSEDEDVESDKNADKSKMSLDSSDVEDEEVRITGNERIRRNKKSSMILDSDGKSEMEESEKREVDKSKSPNRSDDDDDDDDDEIEVGRSRMSVDVSDNENDDLAIRKSKEKTALDSGEDEEMGTQVSNKTVSSVQTQENPDLRTGSDSSNDGSVVSNAGSNKRSRREIKTTNVINDYYSDESDDSKSKRRRYIDSDSDGEGPVLAKTRKRVAFIDSDSDGEAHSLDDIRSK